MLERLKKIVQANKDRVAYKINNDSRFIDGRYVVIKDFELIL